MSAANCAGVTIPIDMVEDSSGQIYQFMKYNGPKYIFQIMQNRGEDVNLLRCSLSLLIVTVTILHRRLQSEANALMSSSVTAAPRQSMAFNYYWAQDSLVKIADAGAVQVCVNLLTKCYNATVQELSLNLLASIVSISDDVAQQMLQPPNNYFQPAQSDANSPEKTDRLGKLRMNTGKLSTVNNEDLAHGDCAHPTAEKPKQSIDFSKFNFTFNSSDVLPISRKGTPKLQKKPRDQNHSCLSYVLSIAVLQKNRHLVIAGCADIVLAMLKSCNMRQEMSEAIAKTSSFTLRSPSENENKKNLRSGVTGGRSYHENDSAAEGTENQTIQWAGLKVLLKFLFRFEKLTAEPKANTLSKNAISPLLRLKDEMLYTHRKVLSAVCQLISGSSTIASYANALPGVEHLIKVAAKVHPEEDSNLWRSIAECLDAIHGDRVMSMRRQRSSAGMYADHRREGSLGTDSLQSSLGRMTAGDKSRANSQSVKTLALTKPQSVDGSLLRLKYIKSDPVDEKLKAEVPLIGNIAVNFEGNFQVDPEQHALQLENEYEKRLKKKNDNEKRVKSRERSSEGGKRKSRNSNALVYDPQSDKLLDKYLASIEVNTKRPILSEKGVGANGDAFVLPSRLEEGSVDITQGSDSVTSNNALSRSISSEQILAPLSSFGAGINVQKDFFERLPPKPSLPIRIEAKDVIDKSENLTQIRMRYNEIANNALRKLESASKFLSDFHKNYLFYLFFTFTAGPEQRDSHLSPLNISRNIFSPPISKSSSQQSLHGMDPLPQTEGDHDSAEEESDNMNDTPIGGTRLENTDAGDSLFDNFKPIFEYPVRYPEYHDANAANAPREQKPSTAAKVSFTKAARLGLVMEESSELLMRSFNN